MEKPFPEVEAQALENVTGGSVRRSQEVYHCPHCGFTEDKTRLMLRGVKNCPQCGEPLQLH